MSFKFQSVDFVTSEEPMKDDALSTYLDYPIAEKKKFKHPKDLFESRYGIKKGQIFIKYLFTDYETGEVLEFNASNKMDKLNRYYETYPALISNIVFD
jgi:hypothetical protein